MTPELWPAVVAVVLLAGAAAGESRAWFRGTSGSGIRKWLGAALAAAAAAALAVSAIWTALSHGAWSPFTLQQAAIGLALAILLAYLVVGRRAGAGGPAAIVSLVALGLLLLGLSVNPGGPALGVGGRAFPAQLRWALNLLGAGATVAAGCGGLAMAVQTSLIRRAPPDAWHAFVRANVAVAAVVLGLGLLVGTWWAWQVAGSLTGGDPREIWLAGAWLVVTMSLWTERLGDRSGRWAAGLAIVAAGLALTGLLALIDLRMALEW